MRVHCDWWKMSVAMQLQMTWIHVAIKVSLTRPVMKHGIIDQVIRHWDGIEETEVKHFVNRSGSKRN